MIKLRGLLIIGPLCVN